MIRVRVRLTFPETLVREPIIARMVKELDIVPNIRRSCFIFPGSCVQPLRS